MARRHHHSDMYITTTLSITLVLVLVGLEAITLLSTKNLIKQVKENISVELVLTESCDSTEIGRLYKVLDAAKFCKEYTTITKEQALEEHIKYLGEDPTKFLEYNPLHGSIVVSLTEEYADNDSIAAIESKLKNFSSIERIEYPKDIVNLVNKNVNFISFGLLGIAVILLIIAIALINNTIRLTIYSKRFIIHTMKLVGATSWFIKRPIIRNGLIMGICASILSCGIIYGAIYYLQKEFNLMLFANNWENLGFIAAIVFIFAIIITYFASAFAANRYIRMKVNDLYYI